MAIVRDAALSPWMHTLMPLGSMRSVAFITILSLALNLQEHHHHPYHEAASVAINGGGFFVFVTVLGDANRSNSNGYSRILRLSPDNHMPTPCRNP